MTAAGDPVASHLATASSEVGAQGVLLAEIADLCPYCLIVTSETVVCVIDLSIKLTSCRSVVAVIGSQAPQCMLPM